MNNAEDKNEFLNSFSNWIQSQDPFVNNFKLNKKVYANSVKCSNKISLDIGNFLEVRNDFLKNGGKVIKEESDMILVEVKSGTFYIKKTYVH